MDKQSQEWIEGMRTQYEEHIRMDIGHFPLQVCRDLSSPLSCAQAGGGLVVGQHGQRAERRWWGLRQEVDGAGEGRLWWYSGWEQEAMVVTVLKPGRCISHLCGGLVTAPDPQTKDRHRA